MLEEIEHLLGAGGRLDPWVAALARELRAVEAERLGELVRRLRADPAGLRAAQGPPPAAAVRLLKE